MKKIGLILVFFVFSCTQKIVKPLPFQEAISQFILEDQSIPSKKDPILFVGSSSFTNWKDVKIDLACQKIINRGFGGSTLEDLLSHKEVLFTIYKPKQIFVYCGENDIANKTPSIEVYNRWLRLYTYIRKHNKKAEIYFISLKPSPSRWHLKNEMQKVNEMIKSFIEKQSMTYFVDIWPMMLESLNTPKSEIFLKDSLHMNKLGYELWINELKSKIDCR